MPALAVRLPAKTEAIARTSPDARQAACDLGARILRGPESLWPVDTGRSKRAWRRTGSGALSRIFNPVPYASYVEFQNGRPARRTINMAEPRLTTAARQARRRETPPMDQRAAESRNILLRAARQRQRLRTQAQLADIYEELFRAQRRPGRGVRTTQPLRDLERLIRQAAAQVPGAEQRLDRLLRRR